VKVVVMGEKGEGGFARIVDVVEKGISGGGERSDTEGKVRTKKKRAKILTKSEQNRKPQRRER